MVHVPSSLVRLFDKEEFAHEFITGKLRFGVLEFYRKIEDSRRDESEGHASVYFSRKAPQLIIGKYTRRAIAVSKSDQNIHSTFFSLNRYYVLCASHPEADTCRLASRYGRFLVRISSPFVLLERVKAAWQSHDLALEGCAFVAPVEYTKDELSDADEYLIAPPHLTYSQKHKLHEEDKEYRYVLQCRVDASRTWDERLTLVLPDCTDICSPITVVTETNSHERHPRRLKRHAATCPRFRSGSRGVAIALVL